MTHVAVGQLFVDEATTDDQTFVYEATTDDQTWRLEYHPDGSLISSHPKNPPDQIVNAVNRFHNLQNGVSMFIRFPTND